MSFIEPLHSFLFFPCLRSTPNAVPTVTEYIQYRWLPRTARGIDVVSRKLIPVVADALATFGVSSVVAAKAIGEQGWMDGSLSIFDCAILSTNLHDLQRGGTVTDIRETCHILDSRLAIREIRPRA